MVYKSIDDFLVSNRVIKNTKERERIKTDYNWWLGEDSTFHKITESDGEKCTTREKYKLRMGNTICNEWSSLLMNERTLITVDKDNTQHFLFGYEEENIKPQLGGKFFDDQNKLINRAFGTGTGACVIRLDNLKNIGGSLRTDSDTSVSFRYLDARNIYPIRVVDNVIKDVVFVTKTNTGYYCEKHEEFSMGYKVETFNLMLDKTGNLIDVQDEKVIKTFSCQHKLFHIVSPNLINNDSRSGLGISVLDNAIDALKGSDNAYDLQQGDIVKGKKMIFLDRKMCVTGSGDKILNPVDNGQTLFYIFKRDINSADSKNYIQEFNPELRIEDSNLAIKSNISLATMKAGLGYDYFSFDDGKVYKNQANYNGSKQVLVRNISKHNLSIVSYLEGLIKSVAGLYADMGKCEQIGNVQVKPDDSIIRDRGAEIDSLKGDVAMGALSKSYYLQQKYGWSEEEALARMPKNELDI